MILAQKDAPTGATAAMEEDDLSDTTSSLTTSSFGEVDLTWDEALEKAKVIGEPIIRAARAARAGNFKGDTQDNGCNELLEVLRNGEGTQISSETYKQLTNALNIKGVENQHEWHLEPPASLPDGRYEMDSEASGTNWQTKKIGSAEYHHQWTKYERSPQAWPQLSPDEPRGFIVSSEQSPDVEYDGRHFQEEVTNPSQYHQHDFGCNWNFTPTIGWNQSGWLEWFWNWIVKIPMEANIVDIYHEPFFDGTATPDGGYALMIQDIQHLPTPRDMSDEQTRLHWHETASGLIHNMAHLSQDSPVDAKAPPRVESDEESEDSVETGDPMAIDKEPAVQAKVPVADEEPQKVYLRPVKETDVMQLLTIVRWHAINSVTSRYGDESSWKFPTGIAEGMQVIDQIIAMSIQYAMPFIVAVVPTPSPQVSQAEAVIGYALLEQMGPYSTDKCTAELQVFVSPYGMRRKIGTMLVDMILSLADPSYCRLFDSEWVLEPGVEDYPERELELTSVHCGLAYVPDKEDEYLWISKWLEDRLLFEHAGQVVGLRKKKKDLLNVMYLKYEIWRPEE